MLILSWPDRAEVSGRTRLRITGDGAPLPNVSVTQHWGIYGYRERPSVETRVTDANGEVEFPARQSTNALGWRLGRRAWVYAEQWVWAVLLHAPRPRWQVGVPGTFTERWGPIVGFDIDLPTGPWAPEEPFQGSPCDAGFNLSDGPDRYVYLSNVDPLDRTRAKYHAYVSGNARAFLGDTAVALRLKHRVP